MSGLKAEVRSFVVKNFLFGQDDGLKDEASLLERGIMDSTGVLELVAYLGKRFGVKVLDHELTPENLDSVEAISRFVERKRQNSTA